MRTRIKKHFLRMQSFEDMLRVCVVCEYYYREVMEVLTEHVSCDIADVIMRMCPAENRSKLVHFNHAKGLWECVEMHRLFYQGAGHSTAGEFGRCHIMATSQRPATHDDLITFDDSSSEDIEDFLLTDDEY